jgi:hypothetical protein
MVVPTTVAPSTLGWSGTAVVDLLKAIQSQILDEHLAHVFIIMTWHEKLWAVLRTK